MCKPLLEQTLFKFTSKLIRPSMSKQTGLHFLMKHFGLFYCNLLNSTCLWSSSKSSLTVETSSLNTFPITKVQIALRPIPVAAVTEMKLHVFSVSFVGSPISLIQRYGESRHYRTA